MTDWLVLLGAVFLSAGIPLIIWGRRKVDDAGFFLGNRDVGFGLVSVSLIASLFGGNTLVTLSSFAFEFGFSAVLVSLGLGAGCILLGLKAGQLRDQAKSEDAYTLSDMFESRWGNTARRLSGFIVGIRLMCIVVIQLIAGGMALSSLVGIRFEVGVAFMLVVVLAYLWKSGFLAVLATDLFQLALMAVPLVAFTVTLLLNWPSDVQIPDYKPFAPGGMGAARSIILVVFGIVAIITAGDVWQRVMACRSSKVAKSAFITVGLLLPVFGFIACVPGVFARLSFPGIDPALALLASAGSPAVSGWLSKLTYLMILCAILSTVDTCLFAGAMVLVRDVAGVKGAGAKKWTGITLIVSAVVMGVVACFVRDIILAAQFFIGLTFALTPPVAAIICRKTPGSGQVVWSVAVGLVVGVAAGIATKANLAIMPLASLASAYLVYGIGALINLRKRRG